MMPVDRQYKFIEGMRVKMWGAPRSNWGVLKKARVKSTNKWPRIKRLCEWRR